MDLPVTLNLDDYPASASGPPPGTAEAPGQDGEGPLRSSQAASAKAGEREHDQPRLFIAQLAAAALAHRASQHPYLEAMATGSLPNLQMALSDFAQHYYGYSSHFPRYLTAVVSRIDNPQHRQWLLENLNEEVGHYNDHDLLELQRYGIEPEWVVGLPHPELFLRFQSALGVLPTPPGEDHLEVCCWRELFLSVLSQGSAAEAVGALGLGTEGIVPVMYRPFQAAIARLGTLHPRDWVFFPLHTSVDEHHQDTLRRIAVDHAITAEGRRDLARGMHKALMLRDSFWSWLHGRALAMAPSPA